MANNILFCSKCKNLACIKISPSYSLCEKHFCEMFEKRVSASVREFSMLKKGEHVAVAVSGGKDSMVLLHMLARLKKMLPIRLSAVLVDEGIPGYRELTIKTAKKECKKLGIPLHIVSFEKEFGKSLEKMLGMKRNFGACAYCGVFRRVLINRGAGRIGADKIAMGHNLDDAAQTVLLNIFRNEPARLMRFFISAKNRPMQNGKTKFIPRVYPLIRCPEIEVAAWAVMHGIGINFMPCPHANEAMRQNVRKMLNEMEEKYPGTKARAFGAFLKIRENWWNGKKAGGDGVRECKLCGEPCSQEICVSCSLLREFEKKK